MYEKKWIFRQGDTACERRLIVAGISPLAAKVLSARKFRTTEAVEAAFGISAEKLHDPLLLDDMAAAVSRLRRAVEAGEKIAVYGDYDVDGIMAVTLLTEWLRGQGADCVYHIPTRSEEGYGLSETAIRRLAGDGVTLIVTVDTGITAAAEVAVAAALGVDIIITDHHECPLDLPAAAAVVNPMRPGSKYPFRYLAGVGVAFMLVLAYEGADKIGGLIAAFGDLVAIGTIADVVPMYADNRVLTALGLACIARTNRAGLKALMRESVQEGRRVTESVVGYSLAPRINAAGRMGDAGDAVALFLTHSEEDAERGAKRLCEQNRLRQKIENDMQDEIDAEAEREIAALCGDEAPKVLVLSGKKWHQGIVGIVASRLSERYACPVFLICVENGVGKGSARSFFGVNIIHMIRSASYLLESWGGHEYAAGFSIKEENIPALRELLGELSQTLSPAHVRVDSEISAEDLTTASIDGLRMLEPYGPLNDPPVFIMRDAEISDVVHVGAGKSARLVVRQNGRAFSAMYFARDAAMFDVCDGDRGEIIVHADTETRGGRYEVLLLLLDIRMPREIELMIKRESELSARFLRGESISLHEAHMLSPKKRDFVALLRHLKRNCDCDGVYAARVGAMCRRVCREEQLEDCCAKLLVCLAALDEKGRLVYTRKGDILHIRLCGDKPVDLNDSELLKRLNDIIRKEVR